ncbi:MAG: hypothetical protein COZ06_35575 [Armatimonadetes bacterium CG_4_10_14_3_um_filter_66_18]|nr:MAG: hypothetical protein AUJ96_08835 [Armatimonadetes bacterium CG2_30_66_41]PIU91225.1 MAG: hypothetical protein COS65_22655 [Armatimonadetes bacterium CG06_land_8_20_14_3_00_66_21]PIW20315.1 MAG: hypothetical protein COW34_02135 [Armatimonadetes bacterium CG17_big_fil_post_rev_8_21_14_2_50_66_6]PIX37504.1 MAG: hypothetical protein COZ57_34020 [Armatimonadetes bacterium CG_4_8_14_3_um_filter_66_20]PIY36616.1 MAG: hypothetical protein COZ06_35575 [Armatimonadetes bacterium CG_4_10_14_3_um_f
MRKVCASELSKHSGVEDIELESHHFLEQSMREFEHRLERLRLLHRASRALFFGMLYWLAVSMIARSGAKLLPDRLWTTLLVHGMYLVYVAFPALATRALWKAGMPPGEALLVFALIFVVLGTVQAVLCPRYDIELHSVWSTLLGMDAVLAANLTPMLYYFKAMDELKSD